MKNPLKMLFTLLVSFTLAGILALGLVGTLAAQEPPPPPEKPEQTPVDGGLTLLAAAGGAYAFKKLRDNQTKESVKV